MTQPLPLLAEEEVSRWMPDQEEAGFGTLATSRGGLPLRAMDVYARIDGLLAQVDLCQTFVNAFTEPLEATYIFPLPDRAAVTRFRMEVGGRVVEGALRERGAARREYDVAMKAGYRAAIAEEERPGVFTLRVGNLMPGEAATIRLTLAGPLIYDSGEVTFRFPLVVAPRYIPGNPLSGSSVGDGTAVDTDAVPDASRISPPVLLPGFPNPVRLSITVDVWAGPLPIADLCCSLPAFLTGEDMEGGLRLVLAPGERLDRDFILRYRLGEEGVRTSLSLLPDHDNPQHGTFALFVVPPLKPTMTIRPRDVVFVLDRSGSMAGWKMVAARRAVARMVDTLTERDRFTVYAFDDHLETPPAFNGQGLVTGTDRNRFRAIEFLAKVESRGGTEMAGPLDLAVKQLAGERDRILVLITDGQVGNEDQILRNLGKRLNGVRVFTLGIDKAVNEGFLKRLATLGGGCCDVVESEDRLDEVMDKVQRRVGTPVLTGLRLEAAELQLDPSSLTPPRLPDLFGGVALTIAGRYCGSAEGSITLQARDEAGRPWSQGVPGMASMNRAISQVWARGQVRALEDRFVIGDGDVAALEKQIVSLSLRFGVLCRFTAYVAVDRSETVNEGGDQHKVTQPVEAPAGWAMLRTETAQQFSGISRGGSLRAAPAAPMPCAAAPPAAANNEIVDYDAEAYVDSFMLDADRAAPQSPPPPSRKMRKAAPPPSGPPTRSKKSDGLLGKIAGAIFNRGEAKDGTPPPAPLDLTAYRRRAEDLLEFLQNAAGHHSEDRVRVLGIIAVNLAALLEDLKSVGASDEVWQPLEKLSAVLQKLMEPRQLEEAEVQRIWSECEETLKSFVGLPASTLAAVPAGKGRGKGNRK